MIVCLALFQSALESHSPVPGGFALLSRFSLAAEAQMSAEAVEEKVKTFVFRNKCAPPAAAPSAAGCAAQLLRSVVRKRSSAAVLLCSVPDPRRHPRRCPQAAHRRVRPRL